MTGFCPIHSVEMTQRESKTKFEQDGSPKTYFAHNLEKGLCFGKPPRDGQEANSTVTRTTNPRSEAGVEYNRVDREEVARGKTRCAVFCAVVEKEGLEGALASKAHVELAVSYIMNGLDTGGDDF
jgi:hypothetical protein